MKVAGSVHVEAKPAIPSNVPPESTSAATKLGRRRPVRSTAPWIPRWIATSRPRPEPYGHRQAESFLVEARLRAHDRTEGPNEEDGMTEDRDAHGRDKKVERVV